MCGRYTNTPTNRQRIAQRFEISAGSAVATESLGRANICPTQHVLAVVLADDGDRHPVVLRWGLAPRWGHLKGGPLLINARDDKLLSSNAWRPLAGSANHRCLIIGDGWLEWQKPESPKAARQPFLHRLRGGELFAFRRPLVRRTA